MIGQIAFALSVPVTCYVVLVLIGLLNLIAAIVVYALKRKPDLGGEWTHQWAVPVWHVTCVLFLCAFVVVLARG